jgi:diacylglycerol kinase (ATP)
MQKILFIANPTSQSLDKQVIEESVARLATQYHFKWKTHYTQKNNAKEKISEDIRTFEPHIVIAVGGDGTINLAGSTLINTKIHMGIIPAGSANGLAYNLDLTTDFEETLKKILQAKAKPFDVIRINHKILAFHLADVGINARTVKRFEQENSHGMAGYGKHMIKEIFARDKSFVFDLSSQRLNKKYRAQMLIIANARAYGTGAVINPVGKTDDGKFEIVIIKPYPWWGIFRMIRMFIIGKPHRLDWVKITTTTKAKITFTKPQDLQSDGEIFEKLRELDIEILAGAIQMRY